MAPDGTWLATGDEAGALRVWDLPSGALRCTLPDPAAEPVTAVVIAADGTRFAATCDDARMRTWDHTNGEAGIAFVGHAATKLAWHPPVSQQDYRFGHTGRDTVWAVAIAPTPPGSPPRRATG